MQRSISLDGQPSTSMAQNEAVAGPSGQNAPPLNLPLRNGPVARALVPGSYSPLGMGQVCPNAPRQVINDKKVEKTKKVFKMKQIPESIEMQVLSAEVTCAGDQELDEIVALANLEGRNIVSTPVSTESLTTEQQCWVFEPICNGKTTVYDLVAGFFKNIITCAPLRNGFKKFCVNGSNTTGTESEDLRRNAEFERDAVEYMMENPRFTQEFIFEHIPVDVIERIYLAMIEIQGLSPECQDLNNLFLVGKPEFMDLINSFDDDMTIDQILVRIAEDGTVALNGEAFRIYRVYPEGHAKFLEVYTQKANGNPPKWLEVSEAETQCMEALRRHSIMCFTRYADPLKTNLPCDSIFIRDPHTLEELTNMILIPMFKGDSEVTHFIEVWRGPMKFKVADVEVAKSFMIWGSVAIMYYDKWNSQRKLNQLNNFLLKSVKAVFEDVLSIDQVVKRTLEYAQTLVNADRASLFMLDEDSQELVSRVFDLGGDGQASTDTTEIRIPIDRGIAGHVALTGETVNIADAYADTHFNHEVDEATGYRTTSILCMPVKVDRKVIGVVQMVNKRSADHFSSEDERSFGIFSTFFGLALHNAGVYDIIARNEQKYRVALDVLSYHNTCRENEVQELRNLEPLHEVSLDDFYLDPFKFNPLEKCQAVMSMFHDLFNLKNFDCNSLTRFVLTVKKNYREVPYHNFHHGWSVAQSMYAILKADIVGRFSYNQDGHNIFDRFSSEEYKDMLGFIKTCILATDLAAFFPNLAQLKVECNGNYDWSNSEHSKLAMALSMTGADLSAAAKPWDIQIETVKVIFEEFYDQGDKERNAGRKPIPMMDRDKPQEQPASQVGFLTSICLPCYGMLKYLLPSTDKMFLMAVKNLEIWQQKAINAQTAGVDQAEAGDSSIHSDEDTVLAKAGEENFSHEGMASMSGSVDKDLVETLREICGSDDGQSHGSSSSLNI